MIEKQSVYDKADNLPRQVNGYGDYPQTLTPEPRYTERYEYDKSGHILLVQSGESSERFVYDPAANLLNQNGELAKANRLKQYNGYHYHYDALGRRIAKTVEIQKKYSQDKTRQSTTFFWQGLRLSGEVSSQNPTLKTHYIYNELSYEPIARIISDEKFNQCEVQYFHTLLNTLPTELTAPNGDII